VRPLGTRFRLGEGITDEQHAFLEAHGYLHFEGVATEDEVSAICAARDRVEREWLADNRQDVNGIPLFFGRGENGETCVQRGGRRAKSTGNTLLTLLTIIRFLFATRNCSSFELRGCLEVIMYGDGII